MNSQQLYRSQTEKRIAGVAGGIAEYFGIDPLLVRIGFIVSALMGFGVLLYVIMWILLPKGPEEGAPGAVGRYSPAVRIAEERFARGEISAEELALIRQDLMGAP